MKALIIPAKGVGDALMMMVAAEQLHRKGYEVKMFHESMVSFQGWFPNVRIEKCDPKQLKDFKLVILQNDDGEKANRLRQIRHMNPAQDCSIFYPRYKFVKHGYLEPVDFVFDPSCTMVENIGKAMQDLLKLDEISYCTGISIPSHLTHRKYPQRVILHPTSREREKNWLPKKYLHLADRLHAMGYDPHFAVSCKERARWSFVEERGYMLPKFEKLTDLAAYIYESGYLIGNDSLLGHMASLLEVPTTIVAKDKKHMALWRPSWLKGKIVTPPCWVINCKGLRLREKMWKHFVFVSQVLEGF